MDQVQGESHLAIRDLRVWFPVRVGIAGALLGKKARRVRADDGITFDVRPGEDSVSGRVGRPSRRSGTSNPRTAWFGSASTNLSSHRSGKSARTVGSRATVSNPRWTDLPGGGGSGRGGRSEPALDEGHGPVTRFLGTREERPEFVFGRIAERVVADRGEVHAGVQGGPTDRGLG